MVRSLRDDDPNKWIEDLFSKMQHKGHWNGRHTEHVYMEIPQYLKIHVKKWLKINRMPSPDKIKCQRRALAWSEFINEKAATFYQKCGGIKCKSDKNKENWFIGNILKSVSISFHIQYSELRSTDTCCPKHCFHDAEVHILILCVWQL